MTTQHRGWLAELAPNRSNEIFTVREAAWLLTELDVRAAYTAEPASADFSAPAFRPSLSASVPQLPGAGELSALRRLAGAMANRRDQLGIDQPTELDVFDPFGGPEAGYELMRSELDPALATLSRALRQMPASH